MKSNEHSYESDHDKLRQENEQIKKRLTEQKGAIFSNHSEGEDLPPEIENEFLKNIEAFEAVYDNADKISVYYFIGRPDFQKVDQIPEDEIPHALDKLMFTLSNCGIALETLSDVEDRVFYTFITEEFFMHKIDNVQMEGMVYHFIYEEFHPNHDYDIRNCTTEFVREFLNKESDFFASFLTKEAEEDKTLIQFRDSFTCFSLGHFEITSLSFDDEKAKMEFLIGFSGIIDNTNIEQQFTGEGYIDLLYRNDFWYIHEVRLPINKK